MEAQIIQLSFPWWADSAKWKPDDDDSDGTPSVMTTVDRPTEIKAIKRLRLGAKIIERYGKHTKLSWLHLYLLRLERDYMTKYSHGIVRHRTDGSTLIEYPQMYQQLAGRARLGVRQVQALLEEAASIIALRTMLDMPMPKVEDDAVALPRAA